MTVLVHFVCLDNDNACAFLTQAAKSVLNEDEK